VIRDGGGLRSQLLGEELPTEEHLVEALESSLEESERVVYQFASGGGLVHDNESGADTREMGGEGVLLAVTDRKLAFVVDDGSEVRTATVTYADLRAAEATSGFLRSEFAVTVWGRGTLRFEPSDSEDLEDAAEYVSEASTVWQRAVAALQDARQHLVTIEDRLVAGETEAAMQARASARDHVETAIERSSAAPSPTDEALRDRAETVANDLLQTCVEARLKRVKRLTETIESSLSGNEFQDADDAFRRARTHIEEADSLSERVSEDYSKAFEKLRERLRDQRERLESGPLEHAKKAHSRAREADSLHEAVRAWEHALSWYRTTLVAGWGTDTDFDGETDPLRVQIEWLAGRVVRLREELADRYEREADTFEAVGNETLSTDRYETACGHLLAAEHLATQYLAGDEEVLRRRCWWIASKADWV